MLEEKNLLQLNELMKILSSRYSALKKELDEVSDLLVKTQDEIFKREREGG